MRKLHLYLLSLASGLLLSAAWPANGFPGLLFIALIPLIFLEDHISEHKTSHNKFSVLGYAYIAFFVFNILTTWWIKNSTLFGGAMAVILNALLMAVTFHVYHISKNIIYGAGRGYFLLIFYWITWEYFHLDWDLSWSWLNLGNAFSSTPSWVQWYEYTGAFGGTFWVLLLNILIYQFIREFRKKEHQKPYRWIIGSLAVLFLVVPLLWSLIIYHNYEDKGEPVEIVITQPNIDPYGEQYEISAEESVTRNLKLADELLDASVDYVVCPESSLQENIWEGQMEGSRSIRMLRKYIEKYPGLKIVIGASTFKRYEEEEELSPTARWHKNAEFWFDAYNTAIYIEKDQKAQTYHKSVLVPGVEKMPFKKYLSFMDKFAIDLGGTVGSIAPDPVRKVIQASDGSPAMAMAVCYESAYGEFFSRFVRNGAEIVFIITNDGWWGDSPGHKQHLQFASLRAIENRRSIARSANTGISCFVNQRGDIIQATNYWKPAVIKGSILANSEKTYYTLQGDFIARIAAFMTAFLLLISITQRILKRKKSLLA